MSRNAESKFAAVPRAEISRSRFDMGKRLLTTLNAGKLVPIYCKDVLPGDTVTMDTATLVRMSTPIFPVMDNCFMDIYYFFVPNRLLWKHWKQFMGENTTSAWTPTVEYTVPTMSAPPSGWAKGSVADYFGIPIDQRGVEVDAMPFRAYAMIWNEFFRDQNYMDPAWCPTGDESETAFSYDPSDPWDGIESAYQGGSLLPVAKVHDYFTSVLPSPQKSEPVRIPAFASPVPVYAGELGHGHGVSALEWNYGPSEGNVVLSVNDNQNTDVVDVQVSSVVARDIYPTNLYADVIGGLDSTSVLGTITELRQAFQIQKLLEADARGGTRYTELLNAHFGVTSPDARLQRPEYLGGKRIPINIDQVLQTSATNDVSPQGNTAAFSLTTDVDSSFTKSFVEHGWIIGLACVRTDHTYQQGLEKMWSRRGRYDYYWPELANISEQPVYFKELVCAAPEGSSQPIDGVFGYQEAWAEYRYSPSQVTGAFRSQYARSLDAWHYADFFDVNNQIDRVADRDFMIETPVNIDRTLAVSSDVEDQFLCNFYFKSVWTRPMPMFSVPGLADHH